MQKGFTLLELLVVIAIIGILSSIVLVSYNGYTAKARIAKTLQWASGINHSLGDRAVGAWTFDNISGATVYDDSGNNNNGTAYGGPAVVDGVVGKALQFDGVDDYVIAGNISAINKDNNYTFSAWINPYQVSSRVTIFENSQGCSNRNGMNIESNLVKFGYYNGASWYGASGAISANIWTHVVGINRAGTLSLYVNGVLQTGIVVPYVTCSGFYLGRTTTQGLYFFGLIDDVRIYSAALSQAQIQQLYADGLKTHQNLVVCDSVSF